MSDVQPFNFRSGIIDSSSAFISIESLYNTTAVLSVDGQSDQNFTMVGIGTDGQGGVIDSGGDGTPALYVGTITVVNLSGWVNFTITHNGITIEGRTTSDQGDVDQQVMTIGCDNISNNTSNGIGAWKALRTFAELPSSNVTSLLHHDDHGYVNNMIVNNNVGVFIQQRPDAYLQRTVYAYALCYAAYLGLLDNDGGADGYYPNNQTEDRIWCWRNIPIWCTPGDHEYANNESELSSINWSIAAKDAFIKVLGATTPYINTVNSAAVVGNIGALEVVGYDREFTLPDNYQCYDPGNEKNIVANNKWLSDAQIADILNALGTSQPYVLVLATTSIRHVSSAEQRLAFAGDGWNSSSFGSQQPLHDYTSDVSTLAADDGEDALATTSQLFDLFLKKGTPMSVLQKAQVRNATILWSHGDTHAIRDQHHYFPETDANVEMDIRELNQGGICNSGTHRMHPHFKPPHAFQGSNQLWNYKYQPYDMADDITVNATSTYIMYDCKAGGDVDAYLIEAQGVSNGVSNRTINFKRNSATTCVETRRMIG